MLSSVAKALESSRKSGTKRAGPEKTSKPATKKTRYSSDSEEESEEEEGDSEEEAEIGKAISDKEEPVLPAIKEVGVAVGSSHTSPAVPAQTTLAT